MEGEPNESESIDVSTFPELSVSGDSGSDSIELIKGKAVLDA